MVNKLNVLTVVGTRPEIIRLSETIKKFDKFFEHILVHSGQNYDYELSDVFYKDLGLRKPDIFLNCNNSNPIEFISDLLPKFDKVLTKKKPDCILILGDTNSSLCAIPAKRRKIPIFHMEAGNRCFNFRVPEEINRRIVDVISDVNLTYSKISKNYLESEGFPKDKVIVTGSPLKEVINKNLKRIHSSKILKEMSLKKKEYLLFSFHREENVDSLSRLKNFIKITEHMRKKYKKKIIISLHPRTKKMIEKLKLSFDDNVLLCSPFGYLNYMKLQINSHCVFSDSGSITEESSILNFKAINLREEHERPEGFEQASVIFTGLDPNYVCQAYDILNNLNQSSNKIVSDYDVDNVSNKIVKIIISHVHQIKNQF